MAQIQTLKGQVEEKKAKIFRARAMERFGHSKGAISRALNEALDIWLSRYQAKVGTIKARDLTGIVSDLKESSLEAQKKSLKWFGNLD